MGFGVMGGTVARTLEKLGYRVATWTRRPRQGRQGQNTAHEDGSIAFYAGNEQLSEFCRRTDVLVCLLPLTPATRGILSANVFNLLPKGATVINAARGGHLVESDLLAALDSGHLASGILDVFEKEPMPVDSPLWLHPKVRIFPHVSSMTNIESAASQMMQSRDAVLSGGEVLPELVVDWDAGY
jgi:glyoxylate/hydroxypyruvate reductase